MNQIPVLSTLSPHKSLSECTDLLPISSLRPKDSSPIGNFSMMLQSQINDMSPDHAISQEYTRTENKNTNHEPDLSKTSNDQFENTAVETDKQRSSATANNEKQTTKDEKLSKNEQENKPEKISAKGTRKADTKQQDEKQIADELEQIEKKLATILEALEHKDTLLPHDLITTLKDFLNKVNQHHEVSLESETAKEQLSKKIKGLISLLEKKAHAKGKITNDISGLKERRQLISDLRDIKKEVTLLAKKIGTKASKKEVHSLAAEQHKPELTTPADKSNQLFTNTKADDQQTIKNDGSPNSFQFAKGFQFSRDSLIQGKTALQDVQQKPGLFKEQLQEVINKARIVVKDANNGNLSLKLYPEHLGKVNVNLGLENGTIHAKFIVDSDEAKAALSESLELLREKLEDEGLSIGNFQVNVQDNKGHFSHADDTPGITLTEQSERTTIKASNEYNIQSYTHNGNIDMVI